MRATNNRNQPISDSIRGMLDHARHNVIMHITVTVYTDLLPQATLTVTFHDRVYRVKFADYAVLIDFLYNRVSWRGYAFDVYTYRWNAAGFGYNNAEIDTYTIASKNGPNYKNARAKFQP